MIRVCPKCDSAILSNDGKCEVCEREKRTGFRIYPNPAYAKATHGVCTQPLCSPNCELCGGRGIDSGFD